MTGHSQCDRELSTLTDYQTPRIKKKKKEGFPDDSVVENPPANAGDMSSIPDVGTSHMPQSN